MLFEEYKKIFEEILAYSEEIVKLYKKNDYDEAEVLLSKRSMLLGKLNDVPEDIDEEKVNYIISIRGKIQELDKTLNEYIAKEKKDIRSTPIESTQRDIVPQQQNNFKYNNINTSQNMSNSIFDFKKK